MDELLNLKKAAELLEVSEKSLLKLLAKEAVPGRKVVGKWMFSRQALYEWVASGRSIDYVKNSSSEENEMHDVD